MMARRMSDVGVRIEGDGWWEETEDLPADHRSEISLNPKPQTLIP
jgi:hypothetical protein